MGMTLTQKILAQKAGKPAVSAGELISCRLDLVLGNDITSPVAIREFERAGFTRVFDREKIALVMDHFAPCKDIKAAEQCGVCRDFAIRQGITHYYDVGEMGIEHALVPEKGLVLPGDAVIGADSHTCTYGALGAFSTGVGSTDMAAGMASGECWFKVPPAVRVELKGRFSPTVSGKDLILHLIGQIGVDGARYQSLEFCGEGVEAMTMDDRFTVANMAVEAGAKNGIFPVDGATREYLKDKTDRVFESVLPDPDAAYERTVEIDLSRLKPTVAFPHLPSNTREIGTFDPIEIHQAVIGSCTNGRLSDLRAAARVLKGRRVRPGVKCIVIPATNRIYLEALKEGLIEIFLQAGAVVSTPTCGPCLGGHMGILRAGERAVSTTNRNFVGRMGHVKSEVYLASPMVAAASAVSGYLDDPAKYL